MHLYPGPTREVLILTKMRGEEKSEDARRVKKEDARRVQIKICLLPLMTQSIGIYVTLEYPDYLFVY